MRSHRTVAAVAWAVLLAGGVVAARFLRLELILVVPRGAAASVLAGAAVSEGVLWVGAACCVVGLFTGLVAWSSRPQPRGAVAGGSGFSDVELRRAAMYRKRAGAAAQGCGLATMAVLYLLALAARHGQPARMLDRWPWVMGLVVAVAVTHGLAQLPAVGLSAYRALRLDPSFGLTARSARDWWGDAQRELVAGGVVALAGAVVVWAAVRVVSPWWLGAVLALTVTTAVTQATHCWRLGLILPLTPAPPALQAAADRLAADARTPSTAVLVAAMRTRRSAPNAFVAGIGSFRRIVVFDSLLVHDPSELRAVLAHEVAHIRHRDIEIRLAVAVVANAVAVAALGTFRSGATFGWFARGHWSPAAYPAFALVLAVTRAYASVPAAMIARRQERAADRFALDVTADPAAFQTMIRNLSVQGLAPLVTAGAGCSHPPAAERLAVAERWRSLHVRS